MSLFFILSLLGLGCLAGFLSGLIGIGGGIIIVPSLFYGFQSLGHFEHAMHYAIGTSLCTIIFTTLSSAYAHHKQGLVDFEMVKQLIPSLFLGACTGCLLAKQLQTEHLKMIFASVQLIFGSYLLVKGHQVVLSHLPRSKTFRVIGGANACLASLVGVGGGVQNVLLMTLYNVPIHTAIATASALSPILASTAALGFVVAGQGTTQDLPGSLGYVHLPAAFCVVVTSMCTAPIGAKIAHKLPVAKLKQIFSLFTLVIALEMLCDALL